MASFKESLASVLQLLRHLEMVAVYLISKVELDQVIQHIMFRLQDNMELPEVLTMYTIISQHHQMLG